MSNLIATAKQYQTETTKLVEYAKDAMQYGVCGWSGAFEDGLQYEAIIRKGSMTILFKTARGAFDVSLLETEYAYSHTSGLVEFNI